jgi:hypothetical protein
MPVRATVIPLSEPGHAVLRLVDLGASPEGLTLSIQRQQGPDSHLADDGWRRTEAWLLPSHVERNEGALDFHLGPEICDRLAGVSTVRLRVKEPDIGVVGATVVAWPAMLTSGAADPSNRSYDETVRLRRAMPPPVVEEPPPPVEPPPVIEPTLRAPDLKAMREPQPVVPTRSRTPAWAISVLVILALTGAGYYAYERYLLGNEADTTPVAAAPAPTAPAVATASPPSGKSIRDTMAEYFATKPTPEAMLAKGREYAQAGQTSEAFLVWRRAAEAGNPVAEMEVAAFYDPISPLPKSGFAPDGARAAEWYERSALAGQAEAQRKLGLLYQKGGAGLAADPIKARAWLQQAAAQNDAEAKRALDAFPH